MIVHQLGQTGSTNERGSIREICSSLQYNVFLRRNERIDILKDVKDSLVPVMWLEEYGEGRARDGRMQIADGLPFHIIRTSLS